MTRNRRRQQNKTATAKVVIAPVKVVGTPFIVEKLPTTALHMSPEIWEKIFKMAREGETQSIPPNLRICKLLYGPALTALYDHVSVGFAQPRSVTHVVMGFERILKLTHHFESVNSLAITSGQNSIYKDETTANKGFFGKSHDRFDAYKVAHSIRDAIKALPNLVSLSIDFHSLEYISEKMLGLLEQPVIALPNLRILRLWAPNKDWLIQLLPKLGGETGLERLAIFSPLDLGKSEGFPANPNGQKIPPVRSYTLGWPQKSGRWHPEIVVATDGEDGEVSKEELKVGRLFRAFATAGKLRHFRLADPFHTKATMSPSLMAVVIEYGAALTTLEIEVAISCGRLDFNPLGNLTVLRLTNSDFFFELCESALPPHLREVNVTGFGGHQTVVMDALSNKNWLPKLDTFDLTFHADHSHIEKGPPTKSSQVSYIWIEKSRSARRKMALKAAKQWVLDFGIPLNSFADQAMALSAARNIRHRHVSKFFTKEDP